MYQKYASLMAAFSLLLAAAWFCVRGVQVDLYVSRTAFVPEPMEIVEQALDFAETKEETQAQEAVLGQPVISVSVLEKQRAWELEEADYQALLKIVEAEAGSEDENGRLLVANVVLNRVKSDQFPDTVREVVYQKNGGKAQFSPVGNGSISRVQVSELTVSAVERALDGEDISQGALYFACRKAADPENMAWFDRNLTRLFAYGGHEFFD